MTATKTDVRVRPFSPDDYGVLSDIFNALWSDNPETPDSWREEDERRDPKYHHRRWVAEVDGEPCGIGTSGQWQNMYHPRKFNVNVIVSPDRQGQGIGSVLFDAVAAGLAEFDPLTLYCQVREDPPAGVRFAQRRGFVERMREWESKLDVPAFDMTPYLGTVEKAGAGGITFRSYAELLDDPDRGRKLWELDNAVSADVPHSAPVTTQPYEEYERTVLASPRFVPESIFMAMDGDRWVGLTTLWKDVLGDAVTSGITGVRSEYRRRGIALALKLKGIAWAKANGRTSIRTWNASTNEPMLAINIRLGFQRGPAYVLLEKTLKQETE